MEQRCDLIGSLQCLRTFSSSHKFQVSSYAGDYDVNPGKLVTEMCTYVTLLLDVLLLDFQLIIFCLKLKLNIFLCVYEIHKNKLFMFD